MVVKHYCEECNGATLYQRIAASISMHRIGSANMSLECTQFGLAGVIWLSLMHIIGSMKVQSFVYLLVRCLFLHFYHSIAGFLLLPTLY